MLLGIYNLPINITYHELKELFHLKCGLEDLIFDNLEQDGYNMKVTVGVPEEEDAALIIRKINGLYYKGQQLFVQDKRLKKNSKQPYQQPSQSLYQHQHNTYFDVNTPVQYPVPGTFQSMSNIAMLYSPQPHTPQPLQTNQTASNQNYAFEFMNQAQVPAPVPHPFQDRTSSHYNQPYNSPHQQQPEQWSTGNNFLISHPLGRGSSSTKNDQSSRDKDTRLNSQQSYKNIVVRHDSHRNFASKCQNARVAENIRGQKKSYRWVIPEKVRGTYNQGPSTSAYVSRNDSAEPFGRPRIAAKETGNGNDQRNATQRKRPGPPNQYIPKAKNPRLDKLSQMPSRTKSSNYVAPMLKKKNQDKLNINIHDKREFNACMFKGSTTVGTDILKNVRVHRNYFQLGQDFYTGLKKLLRREIKDRVYTLLEGMDTFLTPKQILVIYRQTYSEDEDLELVDRLKLQLEDAVRTGNLDILEQITKPMEEYGSMRRMTNRKIKQCMKREKQLKNDILLLMKDNPVSLAPAVKMPANSQKRDTETLNRLARPKKKSSTMDQMSNRQIKRLKKRELQIKNAVSIKSQQFDGEKPELAPAMKIPAHVEDDNQVRVEFKYLQEAPKPPKLKYAAKRTMRLARTKSLIGASKVNILSPDWPEDQRAEDEVKEANSQKHENITDKVVLVEMSPNPLIDLTEDSENNTKLETAYDSNARTNRTEVIEESENDKSVEIIKNNGTNPPDELIMKNQINAYNQSVKNGNRKTSDIIRDTNGNINNCVIDEGWDDAVDDWDKKSENDDGDDDEYEGNDELNADTFNDEDFDENDVEDY